MIKLISGIRERGGEGSGNFGHAGGKGGDGNPGGSQSPSVHVTNTHDTKLVDKFTFEDQEILQEGFISDVGQLIRCPRGHLDAAMTISLDDRNAFMREDGKYIPPPVDDLLNRGFVRLVIMKGGANRISGKMYPSIVTFESGVVDTSMLKKLQNLFTNDKLPYPDLINWSKQYEKKKTVIQMDMGEFMSAKYVVVKDGETVLRAILKRGGE